MFKFRENNLILTRIHFDDEGIGLIKKMKHLWQVLYDKIYDKMYDKNICLLVIL